MKMQSYSKLRSLFGWLRLSARMDVCAAFFCIVTAGQISAQTLTVASRDTLRYSVEDAVLTALERNPTVTIQRITHEITDTFRREERAAFDPYLSIGASRNENKSQRFLGTRREPVLMETQRIQYNASASEALPTGTTVSVDATMGGYTSNIYTNQYTGSVGVTVTQSLLQGFGLGANLAGLRQADLDMDISHFEMKGVAEGVIADVVRAYWELYLTAEEIDIQEKSVKLAEQQLNESEERVAVGKLPELELAAVHAEVATRREALIQARVSYEQARLQFLFLLNPESLGSWETAVVTTEHPSIPSDTLEAVDGHVKLGMMYRPDLIQARLQLEKGEIDVVQTRNGLLPQLDVFITLGRTSYADTFDKAKPDIISDFYDATAGFTFNIPFVDRTERARYARAQHTVGQRGEALHNLERMVQRDVRSSYIEVSGSRQLIEASRISRELQEKKHAAEQEKFRVGKSTNFLVLQVQRDYTLSQLTEARSLVSYISALTNLYLMEGTLLERNHIDPGIK